MGYAPSCNKSYIGRFSANDRKRFFDLEKGLRKEIQENRRIIERNSTSISSINERITILEKDVKQIRETIHPGMTRKEYLEMDQRLTVIEDRLGIKY